MIEGNDKKICFSLLITRSIFFVNFLVWTLRSVFKTEAHEEAISEFLTTKRASGEPLPNSTPVTFGEWVYDFYELEHENIMYGTGVQTYLGFSKFQNDQV